ncbi:hypothetical protein [Chitinophaga eiseniae]|uniref:Delta-60 repeat domain-containing protein/Por secretion system C-terminal sorting domain-containing protein n=1 Tax=Chitinophaga eiseniae TaxID=634771 RepID=A0A847SWP6_9BACT|nr:hypothetical protein [Chitinophaga eiseniae]NLR82896.1 hypothetical protein [Chitinophaga eiseniae]
MRNFCFVLLFVISCIKNGIAQPSGLDSSFGVNGKVIYSTPATWGSGFGGIVMQPDNKIIVCGGAMGTTFVARYKNNGVLDSSFGINGKYSTPPFSGYGFDNVILQPDGKILLGGLAGTNFSLFRLKTNGTPDSSFGSGGSVAPPTGGGNFYYGIAIQPDGKIVEMGTVSASNGSGNAIVMYRFLANGLVDSSFGANGRVYTETCCYGFSPRAIMVQPDGKILVGTQSYEPVTQASVFACLRYLSDGSLDTTFNHTGTFLGAAGFLTYVKTMALQPDGKIVLGGAIDGSLVLQRIDSGGTPDNSFGINSIATADTCTASCMALRANGNIVVGGYTTANSENWVVMQFKPNGTLDSSFSQYGKIFTPIGIDRNRMYDLTLQTDGKIVACGHYGNYSVANGQTDAIIIRYHSDGRLIVPRLHIGINPDITLYPLPVSDLLHINTPANAAIADALLYSIDGRSIARLPVNNNTLNVAGFPNGQYLLRLQFTPSFSPITRKIIINH